MFVADVVKSVATRNEKRDNGAEENSVGAIAMCAPRIFQMQWNERANEHEGESGEETVNRQHSRLRRRRPEFVATLWKVVQPGPYCPAYENDAQYKIQSGFVAPAESDRIWTHQAVTQRGVRSRSRVNASA